METNRKAEQAKERQIRRRASLRERGLMEIKPWMAPWWITGINGLVERTGKTRSQVVTVLMEALPKEKGELGEQIFPDDYFPYVMFCPRHCRKQVTLTLTRTQCAWLKEFREERSVDQKLEALLMQYIVILPDGKPVLRVARGADIPLPEFKFIPEGEAKDGWVTAHEFRKAAREQAKKNMIAKFLKAKYGKAKS